MRLHAHTHIVCVWPRMSLIMVYIPTNLYTPIPSNLYTIFYPFHPF